MRLIYIDLFNNCTDIRQLRFIIGSRPPLTPNNPIQFFMCPCLDLRVGRHESQEPEDRRRSGVGSTSSECSREHAQVLPAQFFWFLLLDQSRDETVWHVLACSNAVLDLLDHSTIHLYELLADLTSSRTDRKRKVLERFDKIDNVGKRSWKYWLMDPL